MARPPAKELTERELEVMHVFWNRGESTVAEVREAMAVAGLDRAYTTIATLVRILADKGFLVQTNEDELLDRVFRGSRELLLVRLMEQKALTAKERALLGDVLRHREKRT
jgi:predicted transcriptional regulator